MTRYVEAENRSQSTLFPESLAYQAAGGQKLPLRGGFQPSA